MSEEILVPSSAAGNMPEQIAPPASSVTDLTSEEGTLLNVGQQLRAAREAKGMSVADVAKVLKLSVSQVVALEEEDWARLHGNTIIRGFVRNYARLFKLDTEPLMDALSVLQVPSPKLDLPSGTNTTLPSDGKPARRDVATVFSGLMLVVVAVLVYFFMPQNFWQGKLMEFLPRINSPEPGIEKNEKPLDSAATVQLAPATTVPSTVVSAPAVLTAPSEASAVPASAELQKPPMIASSSGLKLSFSQPSWVEIRDRSGEIIFSQLNPAGSQRDIEGQPPFVLVIGNATNVTVQYKGEVIELSQRSKDDVARLTLD